MTPVTISGRSQGTMIERARERPPREPEAEQQGEGEADDELDDERDPTVNSNVWTIASRLVGSFRMKR